MEFALLKAEIKKLEIPIYPLEECQVGALRGHDSRMFLYEGTCTSDGHERDVAYLVNRKIVSHRTDKREKAALLRELRDEVLVMGRLKYQPNIVQILGVTFRGSSPIALMELGSAALGPYLRERRQDGTPCGWVEKVWLSLDVLIGIQALHEAGIIHGDLRDSNIFVFISEDGVTTAKISVFGSKGFLGGSAPFLAPECTHSGPIDFPELIEWRSRPPQDLYSFGLVVWLISMDGTRPYKGVEDIETAKAKDPDLTDLMNQLPDDIPPELRAVISGTTSFLPTDRVPVAEAKAMLRRMLDAFLIEKESDSGIASATGIRSPNVELNDISNIDSKLEQITEQSANGAFRSNELKAKLSMLRFPIATSITTSITDLSSPETPHSPYDFPILKRQRFKDAKEMFETAVTNGLPEVQRIKSQILPIFQTMLFQEYLEQAEAGHIESQYNVGVCYEFGFGGITSSLQKAFGWYSKAAEAGYFVAQNTLGLCYEHGKGTAVNLALASDWYQRSAQTVLGAMHGAVEEEIEIPVIPIVDVHQPLKA